LNVAAGLAVFRGSEPRALLEELLRDSDDQVHEAAKATLRTYD
jgi:hypothetical protein